jgi:hypothetical protein
MKNSIKVVLFGLLAFWIFSASECNKPSANPYPIPTFSYLTPIINPPDTFQIAYNLSSYGDKFAHVTFADSAVWLIERLGDGRATIRIEHNPNSINILASDTLAMIPNDEYVFIANNNNYDIGNFFIQLTKLPVDYHTFEPKFK